MKNTQKRHPKALTLFIITSFLSLPFSPLYAQKKVQKDTIHVGINNQIIQVTPPDLNTKVRISLDDSAVTYQIEITKIGRPQKIPASSGSGSGSILKHKSRKSYQYNYLPEVEIGYGLGNVNLGYSVYNFPIRAYAGYRNSNDVQNFNLKGLQRAQSIFINLNLRDKIRTYEKGNGKFYSRNTLDLRLTNHHFDSDIEISRFTADSIQNNFSTTAKIDIQIAQISKRWIQGFYLNSAKNMSLELGASLGFNIPLGVYLNIQNSPEWANQVNNAERFLAGQLARQVSSTLRGGLFLGYNYKKMSISARINPQVSNFRRTSFSNVFLGLGYKI